MAGSGGPTNGARAEQSGGRNSSRRNAAIEDRLPPQNLDAERGVLGAILLDNDALHDVAVMLRPEDFYRDSHQVLFRSMRELYDQGKPVDALVLAEDLTRRGQYEQIGGDDTLAELLGSVPHAANARFHAGIVREKSIGRMIITAANEILRLGYSNTVTADDLLEEAERQIFHIAEDQVSGETIELREVVTKAMDRIVLRSQEKHPITGVASGFLDLDDITGGFQAAQLVILAARPSMGKTALALNICDHAAIQSNVPVLFVSLEMGQLEIGERLLAAHSHVDGYMLRTGKGLVQREMLKLSRSYEALRAAPLFIDDTPARNMIQITANARRLKARHGIGLVVIDYIQLIDSESGDGRESRQEQIAKISRRLKVLARELGVPVIALSQLNRAVENREDRRPRMADLRESGAIEQDADLVLLLHRPEYYDPNDQPGTAELILAKNRNGATGSVNLAFLRNIMRFSSLKDEIPPLASSTF